MSEQQRVFEEADVPDGPIWKAPSPPTDEAALAKARELEAMLAAEFAKLSRTTPEGSTR